MVLLVLFLGLLSLSLVLDFLYFFTDFPSCSLVCRTAGLPQYGQLGHGTDNEVCAEDNLSLTRLVHISASGYHSQSYAG